MKDTTNKVNFENPMLLKEAIDRNLAVRESYHKLEDTINGKRWTIEEYAEWPWLMKRHGLPKIRLKI